MQLNLSRRNTLIIYATQSEFPVSKRGRKTVDGPAKGHQDDERIGEPDIQREVNKGMCLCNSQNRRLKEDHCLLISKK